MQRIKNYKDKVFLYVEDEDETREIFTTILEKLVSKIYVASNGIDGVELYKTYKDEIDLVITDLHLPFLSGQEMINEVRKIDEDVPILITSSFLNELPKDCDVCAVLTKPFSKTTLMEVIDECLV